MLNFAGVGAIEEALTGKTIPPHLFKRIPRRRLRRSEERSPLHPCSRRGLQPLQITADAPRIGAVVAAAHSVERAHVDAATRLLRRETHHNNDQEAEQ